MPAQVEVSADLVNRSSAGPISSDSTEADLVRRLVGLLPMVFGPPKPTWLIQRELTVGRSTADIVLLSSGTDLAADLTFSIDALTLRESVILSLLRRHGPTRLDRLEQMSGLGYEGFRGREIDRLLRMRILRVGRDEQVFLPVPWTTRFRLIAIEAKLHRWRQALVQAMGYRRYADYSYVALPRPVCRHAITAAPEFRRLGIGLLLADDDGLTIAVRAPKTADHDWRREFALSRMVGAACQIS